MTVKKSVVNDKPKRSKSDDVYEKPVKSKRKANLATSGWGVGRTHDVIRQTSFKTEPAEPTPDPMFEYLRQNLRLELGRPDFTDPNNRRISLMLCDQEISSVYFDVVQKREYEG